MPAEEWKGNGSAGSLFGQGGEFRPASDEGQGSEEGGKANDQTQQRRSVVSDAGQDAEPTVKIRIVEPIGYDSQFQGKDQRQKPNAPKQGCQGKS